MVIAPEQDTWEAAGLESADHHVFDCSCFRAAMEDSSSASLECRLALIASEAVQKPEVVIEVASMESAEDSPSETSMDETEDVSEFLDLVAPCS